jgi:hypothetical protein
MLIRPAIGDTDPIRYRRPTPDGQFSGNIIDEAMRRVSAFKYCRPNDTASKGESLEQAWDSVIPDRTIVTAGRLCVRAAASTSKCLILIILGEHDWLDADHVTDFSSDL